MYTPKCTSTNPHGVMIRIQNPTGWLNMDQQKQTSKVVPTKKRSGLLVLEMTSKICCEVVQYTVTRAHIDVVITSLNPKSLYCNQELTWFTSRVMRKNVWETEHLESYHLINSGKFGTLIRKKSGLIFVRRFVETIYIYIYILPTSFELFLGCLWSSQNEIQTYVQLSNIDPETYKYRWKTMNKYYHRSWN